MTVNITTKQIQDLLLQDVVAAYPEYARNNSLPDPANLGTYFLEYMQTEDGQNRLMNGLMTLVDTSEVQTQFSQAMETYMKSMMTSFTDAITKGIESKFTEIMEQVEKQLTKGNSDCYGADDGKYQFRYAGGNAVCDGQRVIQYYFCNEPGYERTWRIGKQHGKYGRCAFHRSGGLCKSNSDEHE
ncbi:MAG: hypothetical protein ACLTER_07105 [Ruminococcus sp.]